MTLHQWQQLAKPNLGGILHPRPGVLTKDFRELEVDIQHVYSLNDLEEDEPDLPNLSEVHGLGRTSINTKCKNFLDWLAPPSLPSYMQHSLPASCFTFLCHVCVVSLSTTFQEFNGLFFFFFALWPHSLLIWLQPPSDLPHTYNYHLPCPPTLPPHSLFLH